MVKRDVMFTMQQFWKNTNSGGSDTSIVLKHDECAVVTLRGSVEMKDRRHVHLASLTVAKTWGTLRQPRQWLSLVLYDGSETIQ